MKALDAVFFSFQSRTVLLGGQGVIIPQKKSQEHHFLSAEGIVRQWLVALRCAGGQVQVLGVSGASLNHSVTSVSPLFGTCKSDLINMLLQQM